MTATKILAAIGLLAPLLAGAQALPPEAEAVRDYLLRNDYPEVFGEQQYRVRVENLVIADLDGDGAPEVVVHMKPHFRQSPTIVIFKVDKDLRVRRVMEALAPGPLQPISGKYLDSHSLGEGVDFQPTMKPGASARDAFVQGIVKSGKGSLVHYPQFFHMDGRKGPPSYIDMGTAALPAGARTCEDFEFADVEQVEVSTRFSGDGRNVIAARVGKQIYAIRIERFLPNGLLEKTTTVHAM